MDPKEIIGFVFERIGQEPSDKKLVAAAKACHDASISLLASVYDEKIRDRALVERDEDTADCVRRIAQALDAVEAGELVESPPVKHN